MENFDPEMLFPPSQEKINTRNEILNRSILSLGIEENQSIIHFGCGSRNGSFAEYIQDIPVKYLGIDANGDVIQKLNESIKSDRVSFKEETMQSVMDRTSEEKTIYDWSIVDGLLDKNLYGDNQYDFIDTIIRKCLILSDAGLSIIMDSTYTKDDDDYNQDFLSAYIASMYNKFTIMRMNEHQYIFSIYKYYY
jgi:hypothetical protein